MFISFLFLQMPEVKIDGLVVDSATGEPIGYAVVVLYRAKDSTQVDGTYTDENGRFSFSTFPGKYYLKVDFIGYKSRTTSPFLVTPKNSPYSIKIALSPSAIELEEAVSEAEPVRVRYEVDRKVITPSSDLVSKGGNAVDILKNAPGVETDMEGNVKIRGSDKFTLLINGRPTLMDPKDALQSIPTSQIERIEIITNPSARFDPEGNAILNIVTKRGVRASRGGMVSLRAGTYDNFGLNFLFNSRRGKWNYYLGGMGSLFGFYTSSRQITVSGADTILYSPDGVAYRKMMPLFLYGGVDYDLSERDFLNVEVGGGRFTYMGNTRTTYYKPADTTYSRTDGAFGGNRYSLTLDYQRKGNGEYEALIYYGGFQFDKDFKTRSEDGYIRTYGNGKRQRVRGDLNGSIPLVGKVDFGYRLDYRTSSSLEGLNIFSSDTLFSSYTIDSRRIIHAGYVEYSKNAGNLSFKAGLRGEYTIRRIITSSSEWDSVSYDRFDLFPTFHTSYKRGSWEFRGSYSRRINRPSDFSLLPIRIWMGLYQAMEGNPDLRPEYIDKVEAGFSYYGKKVYLSADLFYSYTDDMIQRYSTLDSNVVVFRVANVGNRKSTGIDGTMEITLNRKLSLDINPLFYRYSYSDGTSGSYLSTTSTLKMNMGFLSTQARIRYIAPHETPVSHVDGAFSLSLGIATFLSRNIRLNLSAEDVLNTFKRSSRSFSENATIYSEMDPFYPRITLSITYIFNRVKVKRKFIKDESGFEMF